MKTVNPKKKSGRLPKTSASFPYSGAVMVDISKYPLNTQG